MTAEPRALVTSNVDPEVQKAIELASRISAFKVALGLQDLTDAQVQLFAMVANHTGLDPFTRQIYAIPRDGKITHQTGIDGYRTIAERTQRYAGSSEAAYEGPCSCGVEPEHPVKAVVQVRKILPGGQIIDVPGVARWHEYAPDMKGRDAFMWKKMPYNQLAKCAEANGLRKAFPRVFGGVYIEDEMQGQSVIDGHATEVSDKPAPASVRERIHARREAVEQPKETDPPAETDPDAPTICGDPSPYEEPGFCGLPIGHDHNHKLIGVDGDIQGSW